MTYITLKSHDRGELVALAEMMRLLFAVTTCSDYEERGLHSITLQINDAAPGIETIRTKRETVERLEAFVAPPTNPDYAAAYKLPSRIAIAREHARRAETLLVDRMLYVFSALEGDYERA